MAVQFDDASHFVTRARLDVQEDATTGGRVNAAGLIRLPHTAAIKSLGQNARQASIADYAAFLFEQNVAVAAPAGIAAAPFPTGKGHELAGPVKLAGRVLNLLPKQLIGIMIFRLA